VSLHVIVLLPTVWAIGLSQQLDQLQGLTSAEQPPLLIKHGRVMGATVGVDPTDDNPRALGHAGVAFLLDDRAGVARTGRAGGHTSDKAWSRKLVSGHTSPSGRVHHAWSCRTGRQLP
jgi:hypothetical protein